LPERLLPEQQRHLRAELAQQLRKNLETQNANRILLHERGGLVIGPGESLTANFNQVFPVELLNILSSFAPRTLDELRQVEGIELDAPPAAPEGWHHGAGAAAVAAASSSSSSSSSSVQVRSPKHKTFAGAIVGTVARWCVEHKVDPASRSAGGGDDGDGEGDDGGGEDIASAQLAPTAAHTLATRAAALALPPPVAVSRIKAMPAPVPRAAALPAGAISTAELVAAAGLPQVRRAAAPTSSSSSSSSSSSYSASFPAAAATAAAAASAARAQAAAGAEAGGSARGGSDGEGGGLARVSYAGEGAIAVDDGEGRDSEDDGEGGVDEDGDGDDGGADGGAAAGEDTGATQSETADEEEEVEIDHGGGPDA
jgi:hypothetical protein